MINPNSQTSQTILERQHAVLYGSELKKGGGKEKILKKRKKERK